MTQRGPIAKERVVSLTRPALAWTAKNPRVGNPITGASRLWPLQQNLGEHAFVEELRSEVMVRSEAFSQPLAD